MDEAVLQKAAHRLYLDKLYLDKQHPAAWRALNGLGFKVREIAEHAGLNSALLELVSVRISQINGCAFCLDMHVADALKGGESTRRIAVLPAWRETELFDDVERAALAIAETVTELPGHEVRTRELESAREVLTDEQYSALSWAAVTMNAFNRVSIISAHHVRPGR